MRVLLARITATGRIAARDNLRRKVNWVDSCGFMRKLAGVFRLTACKSKKKEKNTTMKPDHRAIIAALDERRKLARLSRRKWLARADVQESTFYRWLQGRTTPRRTTLKLLSSALDER